MLLEMKSVQKRFGGVTALRDANLQVREGEVHLLMGENGAGKSTLMKIVAGMQGADSGEVLFRGQRVNFANPKAAASQGITQTGGRACSSIAFTLAASAGFNFERVSR